MQATEQTKTLDDFFADWESHVFGFGYGTGEPHTLAALRQFLEIVPPDGVNRRGYDHEVLERALTPTVAWLLINILGHADIIEYGTSPRYGWLTPKGYALRSFMLSKSVDELDAITARDENYAHCMPDVCNCGPRGYQDGVVCPNPFFHDEFADKAGN
jgi:hypothetical protein